MVYSPPRPSAGSSSSKTRNNQRSSTYNDFSSPISPADEQHQRGTPSHQQQQVFDESPSFVHSSHSRHETEGTTFRQQQQQKQSSSSSATKKQQSRSPAAWVNASLNPQRKAPPQSNSNNNSSKFRKLETASTTNRSAYQHQKRTTSNNNTSSSHQVALVPSAADMVAIRRIAEREARNPANPSSPSGAFEHTGHRTNSSKSLPPGVMTDARYSSRHDTSARQLVMMKGGHGKQQQHPQPVSRSVQYDDDDNDSADDDEEEEEEDEEYRREYEEKLREAQEKAARFADANRRQAARKDAHKKIANPISPSRVDSSGKEAASLTQSQKDAAFIKKKRPTYVVLGEGGKVEDVLPINDGERTRAIHRQTHQQERHFDPRYREYEVDEDDQQNDDDDDPPKSRRSTKKNKTTYVVTRGYSFDIQDQVEREEQEALEEARAEHRRRMKGRGPLFSPTLPSYPNQAELELKVDEENKDNAAIQIMEKQFNALQKQLMENNKQMIEVSEERLRVLARTLADAEDQIREERSQNELVRAELATSLQTAETLQTTLSSERTNFVKDRDAIRKEHHEHIKSLEQDWTMKIEKANNEIARFLTAQEFEREQHSQQINQMRKRQRDLEDEVKDLQTEVAIHMEGAKRAARIVEAERQDADDRIVAAHARADGVEFIHQTEEGKLKAQIKELQLKLEASMKSEEKIEGELYQMLRRVEDGKSSSQIYERKYNDVTAALEVELERSRALSNQVDFLKTDLAQSEGEKEARKILEKQNDELERQLAEMRRTVSQLMKIAQQ